MSRKVEKVAESVQSIRWAWKSLRWEGSGTYSLSFFALMRNNGSRFRHHLGSTAVSSNSLAPADSSCLYVFTKCCLPGLLWPASSPPNISWCPVPCTVSWAFWCHSEDVSRKPESSLTYDVLYSRRCLVRFSTSALVTSSFHV